jgi:RHS repeat-associated protein
VLDATSWQALGGSQVGWAYLYQGGRLDGVTGLYLFRHRDYSPTLGRWLEQDPLRYAAGADLYEDVAGRPSSATDPLGTSPYGLSPPDGFTETHLISAETKQVELGFLSDFITYNTYVYEAERRIPGACDAPNTGSFAETSTLQVSSTSTSTTGGKLGGGLGGGGNPSASGEVSGSIARALGITLTQGTTITVRWNCPAKPDYRAIAVLKVQVTEISGVYTVWHWFSGDNYEFHAYLVRLKGWDCQYESCPRATHAAYVASEDRCASRGR